MSVGANVNIFTAALDQMQLSVMGANKRVGLFEKGFIKLGKVIHDTAIGSLLVYGKQLIDVAFASASLQETQADQEKAMKKLSIGSQILVKGFIKMTAGMKMSNAVFEMGVAHWGAGNKALGGLLINTSRLLAVMSILVMVLVGVFGVYALYTIYVDGMSASVLKLTGEIPILSDAMVGLAMLFQGDAGSAIQMLSLFLVALGVAAYLTSSIFIGALVGAFTVAAGVFNWVENVTGSTALAFLAFAGTMGYVVAVFSMVMLELGFSMGTVGTIFHTLGMHGLSFLGTAVQFCTGIALAFVGLYLMIKEPLDSVMYYFGMVLTFVGIVMAGIASGIAVGGVAISAPIWGIIALVAVFIADTIKILASGQSFIEVWKDRIMGVFDFLGVALAPIIDIWMTPFKVFMGFLDFVQSTITNIVSGIFDSLTFGDKMKDMWNGVVGIINEQIDEANRIMVMIPIIGPSMPKIPNLDYMAKGGPVTGGKPYIVGEEGPELFSPGSSGRITPNHELGGGQNITLNINVGGVTDRTDKRALAREIGDMLTQEMRRQGGSPTRGRF